MVYIFSQLRNIGLQGCHLLSSTMSSLRYLYSRCKGINQSLERCQYNINGFLDHPRNNKCPILYSIAWVIGGLEAEAAADRGGKRVAEVLEALEGVELEVPEGLVAGVGMVASAGSISI
ncbi:hypothetical protein H5410_015018 [Solanum commersonii]|uniref:Uncharacterized protein n=1 Tax=Solanum commersonii TaxID=4109 RepID=A0A9J5ZT38_SOLCO|nr:hypothetical protein H5410_015018 [Solanum commersonii]